MPEYHNAFISCHRALRSTGNAVVKTEGDSLLMHSILTINAVHIKFTDTSMHSSQGNLKQEFQKKEERVPRQAKNFAGTC